MLVWRILGSAHTEIELLVQIYLCMDAMIASEGESSYLGPQCRIELETMILAANHGAHTAQQFLGFSACFVSKKYVPGRRLVAIYFAGAIAEIANNLVEGLVSKKNMPCIMAEAPELELVMRHRE